VINGGIDGKIGARPDGAFRLAGLRDTLLAVYTPRHGAGWEEFLDSVGFYARIEARRMFSFQWKRE
jgi:hypothetical protein